jgi:hypothetical protein
VGIHKNRVSTTCSVNRGGSDLYLHPAFVFKVV